jgi:glucose-1-phosphate adenylyltransferase
MAADGCVIEGEVENSILFRGVKVKKGAKVKNCILMQDTVVEENVNLEYVITDKRVTITEGKTLTGTDTFQVFVAKKQNV